MKVTVKLFAHLREAVGANQLEREIKDGATISELLAGLQGEFPGLDHISNRMIIALNQQFASAETHLQEGDEVALFPPVSGGEAQHAERFQITFEPISLDEVASRVVQPHTGAVAVFGGTVRNVTGGKAVAYLEYESYEEMALAKLRQVAQETRDQWPDIVDIAIVQRIGHLEVGETAVAIAVSSGHRYDGCFEACRYAIDRLKQIVPIWKKEVGPDGATWIEGDYHPGTTD
ncbi:MAG: molybdopterin converting factor subunit 1 [Anaerolineae bacterium]